MHSFFQNFRSENISIFQIIPLTFFLLMFCLALGFENSMYSQSVYDQKRIIQLVTFILLGVVLLFSQDLLRRMQSVWANFPTTTRRVLLLVAVLGVISSYFASLPKHAFQEWSLFGLLFIFTLYVGTQLSSFLVQKIVLAVLAIGISLYSWRYLAGVYLPSLGIADAVRGYGLFIGFAHPRFLNQIQSWVLPLLPALVIVFRGVQKRYQWLLWLPGILCWTLLFASSGRATLIAMIVSAVAIFIFFHRKCLQWLKLHVLFAISGLIFYLILFQAIPQILSVEMNIPNVTERLAQDGLMGRERLWGLAWELTRSNPLLGMGPQQYANFKYHAIAAHPHSAPLQWMSELGIVSFGLVLGVLVFGFIRWLKFSRREVTGSSAEQSIVLIGLTASLIAGSIHALVSGIIVMPFSQMIMCMIIGWALAVYNRTYISADLGPVTFHHVGFISVVILFLLAILYASYPNITHIDKSRAEFITQHPEETIFKPRFWNQGLIGWRHGQP
jgi:putative inorganic carbon (HCO3(-)) transporter